MNTIFTQGLLKFAKKQVMVLSFKRLLILVCAGIFFILMPFSWYMPINSTFAPGILQIYAAPVIYATDFGIISLFIAFIFHDRAKNRYTAAFHHLFWPLFALALLGFIFAFFASNITLALYTATRWLLACLVFILIYRLDLTRIQIVSLILISFLVQAGVGIVQAIAQHPLGLLGELTLGFDDSRAAVLYTEGTAWLRSYGLTFHPNVLGGFLACGLILITPFLTKKRFWVFGSILLIGLFFTFSRSAWISAGIILIMLGIWVLRRKIIKIKFTRIHLLLICIVAGIVFALFSRQIFARINPVSSQSEIVSISGRVELIRIAFEAIRSHPLTGIGAGNFPVEMLMYNTMDDPHYVHNVSLLLATEIGVFGGLIWLWLWLAPAFQLDAWKASKTIWPIVLVAAWFAWGMIGLWDCYPWSLESGRQFSVTMLALIARETS